ncbi:hypothetical protein EUX98_g1403 [Antrodiella citrinella]|uniref:Uncharacterized protein n=1 Tax=Antrodiella citrinella TaxID=2447956 RepID=A0A4S4N3Y9_9APHY|nr:hypothetical protein EUX98_g1403 [Antrodiella citrinella]
MPLFSHKNKQSHAADNVRHGQHDQQNLNATQGAGPHQNAAPGVAGTVPGQGAGPATGTGRDTAGYGGNTGYNNQQPSAGQPGVGQQQGGQYGAGQGPGQQGVGHPGYGNNNPNLAPTNHFNNGQQSRGGSSVTGKMEHAVGSLVGSQALKAKGMQKEQEAQSFQAQSTELAEAERLEKEAMLRRERAVQHGAHPSNKPLGGIQNQNNQQGGGVGGQGY